MTDLERFVETYQAVGIKLKVNTTEEGSFIILQPNGERDDIQVTKSEKFDGWDGFHSKIEFDKDGVFVKQGFWE